ncbi:MAG TPA: hypothetical protein VFL98_01240 [Candidatus Paceibacterota bacterium]|nr:hypothetical protein [Candidatus Paceibacterota bacterium]
MPGEFLIVLPIEPIMPDTAYAAGTPLPMHCTLMPWFRWAADGAETSALMFLLEGLAGDRTKGALQLVSAGPDMFGPNGDVPVHVLSRNRELELLHTRLLISLAMYRVRFRDLAWLGAGYRPHVGDVRVTAHDAGRTFAADRIVLISRNEAGAKIVTSAHRLD